MSRPASFSGFLLAYSNNLCGLEKRKTRSVKKLFKLAEQSFPTAAEALFLYAVDVGKVHELMTFACNSESQRFESYQSVAALYTAGDTAEGFVESHMDDLPDRYMKVYEIWKAQCSKSQRDAQIKELMRKATLKRLGSERGAIRKMCLQNGFNLGNTYAYLKGDVSKVSLETARRIHDVA